MDFPPLRVAKIVRPVIDFAEWILENVANREYPRGNQAVGIRGHCPRCTHGAAASRLQGIHVAPADPSRRDGLEPPRGSPVRGTVAHE